METNYNLRSKTTSNQQQIECYSHTNSRGVTYYLHKKDVVIGRNHHYQRTNYYFAQSIIPAYACGNVPEGKEVIEYSQNGLLYLKKK